ncbi:SPOR domain-containing protein [Paenibacillus gansuensis]|uniref:SPOR domain-containing protein n=1 Tax=Paenibacillus gansuensis TaxID=306542 RepID=A0ABW5PBG6_9BACL
MSKARITYRFDQTGRSNKPEPPPQGKVISLTEDEVRVTETIEDTIVFPAGKQEPERVQEAGKAGKEFLDPQPLNQFTTDFGAWQSPFTDETYRLEKLIRESDHEAYPGAQSPEPELPRLDGESGYYRPPADLREQEFGPFYEDRPLRPSSKIRTVRTESVPLFKIFGSVTAAIATGALFGYVVLSLFSPGSSGNLLNPMDMFGGSAATNTQNSGNSGGNLPGGTEVSGNEGGTPSEAAAGTAEAAWPSRTYYVLQNGVFSSQEGAETAKETITGKGFPVAWEAGDKYTVFTGLADTQEQAKLLSGLLQQQQLEVYVKPFVLPAVSRILWSGEKSDAPGQYAEQSGKLVRQLAQWTQAHLQDEQATQITEAEWNALTASHQQWMKLSASASAGLPEAGRKLMAQMNTAMSNAVLSMEEYKKQPSGSYLWQAQNALLQFILAEKEWLTAISADPS